MSEALELARGGGGGESEASRAIAHWIRSTYGPQVILFGDAAKAVHLDVPSEILRRGYKEPAVVASHYCAGGSLELALRVGSPVQIGTDVVSRCVNEVATLGAEPLLFLPHLELTRRALAAAPAIFEGMAASCREAGCALVGGDRPEALTGRARGRVGLVGFAVGVAERSKLLLPASLMPGDGVVAVFAHGLHHSGLRRIQRFVRLRGAELLSKPQGFGTTLGRAIVEPREVRVRAIQAVLRAYRRKKVIRAIVQVGEGGPVGALEGLLGRGLGAVLLRSRWEMPPLFGWIQRATGLDHGEMFRTFDMGTGLLVIAAPYYSGAIAEKLRRLGVRARLVGRITTGARVVLRSR